MTPHFTHRSCYVNFAEHLQNRWNVNLLYPGAPNQWSAADWRAFLQMLKAFGFTCFEYWVPPTLFDRPALDADPLCTQFAATLRQVTAAAHELGLQTKALFAVNTIGPTWFCACPHVAAEKDLILRLWDHWVQALEGTDLFCIFPGDPGGCNRNGCTHETFVDLALEITCRIKRAAPQSRVEVGTWGTPFTGWGADMRTVPGWDGSFRMIADPQYATPEMPCHIWNGRPDRARAAMEYLLQRLPAFPDDTLVALNLGFSPDGDATMGGDARGWAREVAALRQITTWDYSVSEGELVVYPHWRLPRMASRRREERSAAPYIGGMHYTMSPKLNLLTLYAAGRLFVEPDADPDRVSREFCAAVFGPAQAALGDLWEAFEVVPGWGHYPRRQWSKPALRTAYREIVARLAAARNAPCTLPLFPDPETYRQDLLWFAQRFLEMASPAPDRDRIRREYWAKSLAIYDSIPMSVDARAAESARRFSMILAEQRDRLPAL